MNRVVADWRQLYPQDASRLWQANGFRMHYLDTGEEASRDSKPVLLCVHGNPTWSFYYREVVKRFSATHRVIAIDHIGCGLSEKPTRERFNYTMANHRDNLVGLIDHLDLRKITLIAHDWGGAIGLASAVERIERISGIILLNTAAFPPPYMPKRIGILRTPVLGTIAIRGFNAFAGPAITMAMDKQRLAPEVAAGLLYPYRSWKDRVAIDSFVRDIPMNQTHPTFAVLEQLERDLSKLSYLPKQLIWGMKDWCFRPECLQRFKQHWPDANVVQIDDAGHYVIEDAPSQTIAAIGQFLNAGQTREL